MIRLKRYMRDGTTRSIWHDAFAATDRAQGIVPRRASRVEVIEEGPQLGRFYVDFTPLAINTNSDRYCFCLLRTFERYDAAVAAEQEWLTQNWVYKVETNERSLQTGPSDLQLPAG